MSKNIFRRIAMALAMAMGASWACAEDIDIYSSIPNAGGAPNVLIVMDNTANWSQSFGSSTKFAAEMTALATVVNALNTQFRLGIMMFTETGSGNTGNDGGYVRFAIQDMTTNAGAATAARSCLLKMVGSGNTCTLSGNTYYSLLDINNDKSNGGKGGVTMGEAYDYFRGVDAYAGNNKLKADGRAFTSGTPAGPTYQAPGGNTCTKNFIIVINNGPFSDNASDTSTAKSNLSAAGGSTTMINPPDGIGGRDNASDEWVRWLNKSPDVAAVTYTLEVGPDTAGQGPYNTSLLQSMGRQGKGGYYSASTASQLLDALTRIFNDINAVNSVFASSSLPLSADNSGAFANQVYMGVFRPDAGGKPRWMGNLKQYKFAADTNGNLYLTDSSNSSPPFAAASPQGFAKPDTVSFWTSKDVTTAPDAPSTPATDATTGSTGGFWWFDAKGVGLSYDSPDGEFVEKGGAAQQLRLAYLGYGGRGGIGDTNTSTLNSLPARKVYTACITSCPASGTALSTMPFDTSNTAITDLLLGTTSVSVSAIARAAAKSVTALSAGTAVSISAISKSGGTGTATTSVNHGFAVGDTVVIAGTTAQLDGTYTVVSVPTLTSFTFAASNGSSSATSGTATKAVTTATATSTAHGFVAGERITVAGASPSGFNGTFTVGTVTANTFTYTLSSALGQSATGTITATSNTVTATATAHGLTSGDSATIAGASPTQYNGVFVVTAVDANTFTYVTTTLPTAASASGTITASVGGGRTTLIRWARGLDTQDENGFQVNGADTDVRASVHGDVLHSRPVVINFGTTGGADNVYVFYGGNDGVFRAIKGGQATTDGKEQWAFIPSEFFGKLKRLYNNSPQVLYSSTGAGITPTPTPRDYFFDGPVGSYVERDTSGVLTKAYLYIAMRRGGRFIYALDVTSPTNPKFLWKKGCPNLGNNTGCDAGFAEMGQTWSQPTVVKVLASTGPVLIFGGGFAPASEDTEPPSSTDTMGRAIYVLDAFTGAPLWAGGKNTNFSSPPSGMTFLDVPAMNFSVAAEPLVLDRTLDGLADRIYATDVGGNVWRVDIGDTDPANWRVWQIASLGDRSATASTRKFLFGADVVIGTSYDAVFVGTGDREHPLFSSNANASQNVVNRFYMIKDTNTGLVGADLGVFDHCGADFTVVGCHSDDLFDATGGGPIPATATGWSVKFATGEKAVNSPLVLAGHILFGTNKPDTTNTTCTPNLGIATRYDIQFNLDSTSLTVNTDVAAGGGFLPSTVSGVVEIDGQRYVFTTDNPLSPGGPTINPTVSSKRSRAYWRELLE